MGDEDRFPNDGADVNNEATNVDGTVVQTGHVEGDVNVHVTGGSPEIHGDPIIVSHQWETATSTLQRCLAILVEGRGTQAVVLRALRPIVLARRPSWKIALAASPILEPRHFTADLGRESPHLVAAGPDFPFTVTASAPEEFRVELTFPEDHDIDWRLELDWVSAGRTGTLTIPRTGYFTA